MMKQIEVNIFLKNMKKPVATAILSKEEQLDELFDEINSGKDVVRFYNIAFSVSEFRYATIEEKE